MTKSKINVRRKPRKKTYAEREYGVTPKQLDRMVKQVKKELDADRKAGRLKPFTGKL